MTDFSKVLIHASSISKLFVEAKDKASKDAGELSATAKTHLIETYIKVKYNRRKEVETKQMLKGKKAELDSLMLLSKTLGYFLDKNEEHIENGVIIGTPDTFIGESLQKAEVVLDVKTSFDIFTFLNNLDGKLNPDYEKQLQAYMWLTGAEQGYVAFCLVDTPQDMIEEEKRRLLYRLNVISEESPEFKAEWAKKLPLLTYSDIPEPERILLFPVEKDPDFPQKCKDKVSKARLFLQDFEQKHLNFNN